MKKNQMNDTTSAIYDYFKFVGTELLDNYMHGSKMDGTTDFIKLIGDATKNITFLVILIQKRDQLWNNL